MNKVRSEYLYDLVGIIREKRRKKLKNREGFKLLVNLSTHSHIPFIQVFKDKLKDQQIWEEIESSKFLDKRYIFHCQNYFGNYHLINWQELQPNHGSH